MKRAGSVVAAATALSLGYLTREWYRYGRPRTAAADPLLDRFMPTYEVSDHHETRVMAPAASTFAAACAQDLQASPVVRAIFRARALFLRAEHISPRLAHATLDDLRRIGWVLLTEDPGHQVVFGAVTQPWVATPRFRSVPPDDFAAFAEPGYVKIVWSLAAEPRGHDASVFRIETRAAATDEESRRRFRRYWMAFSPGIRLIRHELLRLVRREAERPVRQST